MKVKIKIQSDFETKILKKFKKFIVTFNNNKEVIEYLKKNKLKVDRGIPNIDLFEILPDSYEEYEYFDEEDIGYKYVDKNYPILKYFTLDAFYIWNKEKNNFKVFFPLDMFIKKMEASRKWDMAKPLDMEEVFKAILKAKNIFLYYNKEYMFYNE